MSTANDLEAAAKALARWMIARNAWQLSLMDRGEWGTVDDENRKPPASVERLYDAKEEAFKKYMRHFNPSASVDAKTHAERAVAGRAGGIMARSLARLELDFETAVPLIGLSKWGD